MTRIRAVAAAAIVAVLASGCAGTASQSASASSSAAASAPAVSAVSAVSATTSAVTASGTWAVVPMGGTGANLFWQLFRLTGTSDRWSLQTPPDIATNGALILAPQAGQGQAARTLTVAIRPSLDLTYTPIEITGNGGQAWSTLAPTSAVANSPDALAAAPGGQLLALGDGQQVSEYESAASGWTALASLRAVARTSPGRECALTSLTAVAFTSVGTPLLGGVCGKPGVAGIFEYSGGSWHLAGPSLPASLAGQGIQVLRLTRTGDTDTALLEAGSGTSAVLAAAWTSGTAGNWRVSPVLHLDGAQAASVSFGAGGAVGVVLTGDRADILQGPHPAWHALPGLPAARSVTLALPAAGETEALAATGSVLTVWKLASGSGHWRTAQTVKVPIEYGSSSS